MLFSIQIKNHLFMIYVLYEPHLLVLNDLLDFYVELICMDYCLKYLNALGCCLIGIYSCDGCNCCCLMLLFNISCHCYDNEYLIIIINEYRVILMLIQKFIMCHLMKNDAFV